MLVDTQDEGAFRELGFERRQPALPEVAEASVVGPAFGVVVVRDYGSAQAGNGQEVKSGQPVRILTRLVDFVYGDGAHTEREGRC